MGLHLVADDAIEDAPGLLGIDLVHVDRMRALERLGDCRLGDFVENYALCLFRGQVERRGEMPGDCFALAVEVGGQVYI